MHGQKDIDFVYAFSMLSELKDAGLFNTVTKTKKNQHFQQGQNLFIKAFHRNIRNNSAGFFFFFFKYWVGLATKEGYEKDLKCICSQEHSNGASLKFKSVISTLMKFRRM